MITQPPSLMRKGIFSKLLIKDYKLMAKKRKEKKIVQTENPKIQKMKKKKCEIFNCIYSLLKF